MPYNDSVSTTPGFSSDTHNSTKKKRRRSPSPTSEVASVVVGSTKKRRPGPSGDRSSRLSGSQSTSRKIRKEDEDEASCQTAQSDTLAEESDLTREFDDPEPIHRVMHVPVTASNGPPVSSSSRPSRASSSNAQGGENASGRSILFDLDEDNDGGEAADTLVGVNDSHVHPSAGDGINDDLRHTGLASGHTDMSVTEQAHCIVIPSYSAWFDYNALHGIERRALPEFFNGQNKSKTPEVYLAYRNFMIDTYRLNPQEYLTFTACRRNLTGDVCAILRVHAFLEQWGLINYQVTAPLAPSTGGGATEAARLAVAASLGPPSTAHFHVLADSASGLHPIGPQNQSALSATTTANAAALPEGSIADGTKTTTTSAAEVSSSANGVCKPEGQPTDAGATTGSTGSANVIGSSQPNSAALTSKPNASTGDPALRTDQYLNNASTIRNTVQAPGATAGDLRASHGSAPSVQSETSAEVKPNSTLLRGASQGGWSDQETLLLLEALEMYRDDWNKVAEHVGSRTQEECILHFLRLPIEDAYLEGCDPVINLTALANTSHPLPPFSKAANPILSTVAFLAAAVDPRVAAAAAQAALTEYAKMRNEVPAGLLHEHKARVEAAVRNGEHVDPSKFGLDEVGGDDRTKISTELKKVPELSLGAETTTVTTPKESEKSETMDTSVGGDTLNSGEAEKVEDAQGPGDIPAAAQCDSTSAISQPSMEKSDEPGDVIEASETTEAVALKSADVTMEDNTQESLKSGETLASGTDENPPALQTAPTEKDATTDKEQVSSEKSKITSPTEHSQTETGKTCESNSIPPNPDSLGTAAACALAAAATKARHLAGVEEKRIKGLVAQLVETQLKNPYSGTPSPQPSAANQFTAGSAPASSSQHSGFPAQPVVQAADHRLPSSSGVTPADSPHVTVAPRSPQPSTYPHGPVSGHTSPTPSQIVQHHPQEDTQNPVPNLSNEASNDSWSGASYSTTTESQSSIRPGGDLAARDGRPTSIPLDSPAPAVPSQVTNNATEQSTPVAHPTQLSEEEATSAQFSTESQIETGAPVESLKVNPPTTEVPKASGLIPASDSHHPGSPAETREVELSFDDSAMQESYTTE
ncbi:unnamed protein product [Echinostoma caproni]|uniref:SWI/SNF complex subunit SMARCC2 n=1 Tax=Echinostoma caproni TaxID=27848 RepID=A0A183AP53_9TREM|nr:unnamed protein product [Echinostoma caproni]